MIRSILIVAVLFLLPACAETELASHTVKKVQNQKPIPASQKPSGNFKIGNSYRVKGKRYIPQETYSYTQTGLASWYGPNFHGKQTANGETFDKYELTAAHKTLQMPSIIRVTNLENGLSIIARVNDRGPFSGKRILDLSERAAELLDFKHKGTTQVKIQVLEEESRHVAELAKQGQSTRGYEVALNRKGYSPRTAPQRAVETRPAVQTTAPIRPIHADAKIAEIQPYHPTPKPRTKPNALYVQTGSFADATKARVSADRLRRYGTTRIKPAMINGRKYYRVQIGPISNQNQAEILMARIAPSNIGEPILIRE